MSGELVLDASVAAKLYFEEVGSKAARAAVRTADALVAPDLLLIEMAHLSVKRLRRGECTLLEAQAAVEGAGALLDEVVGLQRLAPRALSLAASHGFSAYDAAYLALAEDRGARVLTADNRLVLQALQAGLHSFVLDLGAAEGPDATKS